MNTPLAEHPSTGPKTQEGKARSARNATSHGLFARDIVLTHLGEDPEGYKQLLDELADQIQPRNLLEQNAVEVIAAASWRLRRLQRWQATLYVSDRLDDLERLDHLDRVMRHETMLHRQIDKAIRQLGRDIPQMFDARARAQALDELRQTETACMADPQVEQQVALRARQLLPKAPVPEAFDPESLDLTVPEPVEKEKCQNELPAEPPLPLLPPEALGEDGWPAFLSESDKERIRGYVAEGEVDSAQNYLDGCWYSYEPRYRRQEQTDAEVLARLDLKPLEEAVVPAAGKDSWRW